MRTLALTILTMGIVLAAGHARAQRYDPAFPVCLYVVPGEAALTIDCSYYTMDQCRASANGQMCSLNPYYAGTTASPRRNNRRIIAKSDQDRPRLLRPDRTRHLGRRSTTGPHRTMITMNRITELPRVTRLAKNNNFSTV